MEIINLTPHTYQLGKRIFVPSGVVCELQSSADTIVEVIDEIPITKRVVGGVVNLPDYNEHKLYIVDHLVRRALYPSRRDLLSPGKILGKDGDIIILESLRLL